MKKKLALIIFTVVCTVGLTIGIASFSLGATGSANTDDTYSNLAEVYSSYFSNIMKIIENSNKSSTKYETEYRVLQIVDSLTAQNSSGDNVVNYLKNYVDAEGNASGDAGNFRLDIIGQKMKEDKIVVTTKLASDSELADILDPNNENYPDLIYVSCSGSYKTSSNDLSAEAKNNLKTYLENGYPAIIDGEVVGIKDGVSNTTNLEPTKAYDYLRSLKNVAGSTSDTGVASVKYETTDSMTWDQFFDLQNTDSRATYVSFNNKGNYDWCKYPASDAKFKILEVVPDEASLSGDSDFKKMLDTKDANGVLTEFNKAFVKDDEGYTADNIDYNKVTVAQLNELVAAAADKKEALTEYSFIYISHDTSENVYLANSNDFSDDTISAIKAFCKVTNKSKGYSGTEPEYINRLIIDNRMFTLYNYDSKTSSSVDTSSQMYNLIKTFVDVSDGSSLVKNVLVGANGFFKPSSMTGTTRPATVTSLINSSSYRGSSGGDGNANFRVLEIEPYYSLPTNSDGTVRTDWYTDSSKRNELTNYLTGTIDQEVREKDGNPYYYFTMTKAKIAAATGLYYDQISVTTVTANSLSSVNQNLKEEYDLIYIGGRHTNIKSIDKWPGYTKLKTETMPTSAFDLANLKSQTVSNTNNTYFYPSYMHTGTFVKIGDQFNNFNVKQSNGSAISSWTRLNGNDITAKIYAQLYDYVDSGLPVICDTTVMDGDYLIGGASANADLTEDSDYTVSAEQSLVRMVLKSETKDTKVKVGSTNATVSLTSFSDDTMTAREESEIDPESYMYQFLYKIAGDKSSSIYHAENVMVGFDSSDVVATTSATDVDNTYILGATEDKDEVIPESLSTSTSKSKTSLISELDDSKYTDKSIEIFNNKIAKHTLGGTIDYANSGAGIQLKHFCNKYVSVRPTIELTQYPKNYIFYPTGQSGTDDSSVQNYVNSKKPEFTFSINGSKTNSDGSAKKYKVLLYYDFDGDGEFSDSAVDGRLVGTSYDDEVVAEYTYTMGKDSVVSFYVPETGDSKVKVANKNGVTKDSDFSTPTIEAEAYEIDEDFVGVMPYKLVVIDMENGKESYKSGTPKYSRNSDDEDDVNKQKIRLLEIIPGSSDGAIAHSNTSGHIITTLCANENTIYAANDSNWNSNDLGYADNNDKSQPDNGKHEFGIKSSKLNASDNTESYNLAEALDDYDVDLTIMTTGQFSLAASKYVEFYCKNYNVEQSDGQTLIQRDGLTESEVTAFESFRKKYYDTGNKKMNDTWNKIIENSNTTTYDFVEEGLCDKILQSWLLTGSESSAKIELGINNIAGQPIEYDAGSYDMVIMGFAAQMGGNVSTDADISNIACHFVRSYAQGNGSLMMGTDTTSYTPIEMNPGTNNWSRNINYYLKETLGMDRFKFSMYNRSSEESKFESRTLNTEEYYNATLNVLTWQGGIGTSYLFTPYTTSDYDSYKASEEAKGHKNAATTQFPGEYFTSVTYNNTYERSNNSSDGDIAGAGATDILAYHVQGGNVSTIFEGVTWQGQTQATDIAPTTRIVQNNSGLLTNYPFTIGKYPNVSKVNGQSLALDTEDPDMQIWYTLAGSTSSDSALYAADPMNGRSYYYMYTCRNIVYTGAGYTAFASDTTYNNDEERELIINAILNQISIHRSGPKVVFSEYTGKNSKNTSKFTSKAKSSDRKYAVLECDERSVDQLNFDFTVTEGGSSLKRVSLYIDNNKIGETEVYESDVDQMINDYDIAKSEVKDEDNDSTKKVASGTKSIFSGTGPLMYVYHNGVKTNELTTQGKLINEAMQNGSFYLTIEVEDEDSGESLGRATMLVKTKSKLFNLN